MNRILLFGKLTRDCNYVMDVIAFDSVFIRNKRVSVFLKANNDVFNGKIVDVEFTTDFLNEEEAFKYYTYLKLNIPAKSNEYGNHSDSMVFKP